METLETPLDPPLSCKRIFIFFCICVQVGGHSCTEVLNQACQCMSASAREDAQDQQGSQEKGKLLVGRCESSI